jgi:hypothetical protein
LTCQNHCAAVLVEFRLLCQIVRDGGWHCEHHEGARTGRIQTWDGKDWKISSDWYTSDDSMIAPMVNEAATRYATEKKITTGCFVTH